MTELTYLDLHGDRIAYRDEGKGPALLLIHGMAGSSDTWQAMIPRLSKKYRVIAPDLLGHGKSAKPRGDYSLGAFAVWLRDLLDELGVHRATVIGQSLGGGIAMQFAYQHREYCDRLVLIGSGGLGPDLSPLLRILSAPGAELVLPVVAPQPVLNLGNKLGSWLSSAGIQAPRASQMWRAYSSLSEAEARQAFLRTLRSVVDHRGQAVSALNKLHLTADLPTLLIWVITTTSSLSHTPTPRMRPCQAVASKCSTVSGTSHMPRRRRRSPRFWRTSSPPRRTRRTWRSAADHSCLVAQRVRAQLVLCGIDHSA